MSDWYNQDGLPTSKAAQAQLYQLQQYFLKIPLDNWNDHTVPFNSIRSIVCKAETGEVFFVHDRQTCNNMTEVGQTLYRLWRKKCRHWLLLGD